VAKFYVNPKVKKSKINKEIYGHFSEHLGRCIYEGLYVGEDSSIPNVNGMRTDVVEALKAIHIPVLRWPGGCFADEYHWMDGIGPKETRKKMINTHWGGVVEDNSFGTHEFMELCRQLGCEPYVNANLGSGTVREMSEWVEYMTFGGLSPMSELRKENGHEEPWTLKYLGVGNENWGCGGNMTPEFYANEYRRYQTYCRVYDPEKPLFKIACGPNVDDYAWTEGVMKVAHDYMDGLSLHYYVHPFGWQNKGPATGFDQYNWFSTMKKALYMDTLVTRHSKIMDRYDPEQRIALIVDEWGAWYDVEPGTNPGFLYQQNTMRDALVASVTLDIFHKHSDRVRMANIAQMVNVLQAVILTEGEKMIKTPTYHVFDLYQNHQDATLVESSIESKEITCQDLTIPNLHESASVSDDGTLNLSLSNLSVEEAEEIEVVLSDASYETISARILTNDMNAHNTFDAPETVKPQEFTAFERTSTGIKFTLPACSVLQITMK
jgi:alpha-N-arabinofuranosidase